MKTAKITEILDYYDGILVFAAQDPIGGQYVASLIERTSQNDRYLVVGARPERLNDLRNGMVDLRTLLLEMPEGQWYITIPEGTLDDPMELEPQSMPLGESDYLPGEDYFLGEESGDEADFQRMLERGNVVALTGQVELANRGKGEWVLLTDSGMKSGKTAPGGPNLDGLQLGKRYRFHCAEVTEPDPLWRNQKVLYLQRIETA